MFNKSFCLILFGLMISLPVFSQPYPVVVSNEGILLGKFKKEKHENFDAISVNSVPDSISVSEAQGIFAVNAIDFDKLKFYTKIKVVEFQLTIENDSKRKTYKSGSEMLNDEIKTALGKVKPGSKIYFEGIKVEHADGSRSGVIMLGFVVY